MRSSLPFILMTAAAALLSVACSGGGNDTEPEPSQTIGATPTPVRELSATIYVSGTERLPVEEYFRRLAELDDQMSAATNALRKQVTDGGLRVEDAQSADFENIGDFVQGLYSLEPPRELQTNHDLRVQSLMAYLVAFQDRREMLDEAAEHDTAVCEQTEQLAAVNGFSLDLECELGDW